MERNLGRCDRAVRIATGIALIVARPAVVSGIIGAVLAIVGVVLVVSGTLGFCHVRKFLGRFGSHRR
jgi:hypothetical protein